MLANAYVQLGSVIFTFTNETPSTDQTPSKADISGPVILTLKFIMGAQGLFLPLTRFLEPFFYTIIARKLKGLGCPFKSSDMQEEAQERIHDTTFLDRGLNSLDVINSDVEKTIASEAKSTKVTQECHSNAQVSSEEESELELQPLYLMLASSLNVELVYVILKSIT